MRELSSCSAVEYCRIYAKEIRVSLDAPYNLSRTRRAHRDRLNSCHLDRAISWRAQPVLVHERSVFFALAVYATLTAAARNTA